MKKRKQEGREVGGKKKDKINEEGKDRREEKEKEQCKRKKGGEK